MASCCVFLAAFGREYDPRERSRFRKRVGAHSSAMYLQVLLKLHKYSFLQTRLGSCLQAQIRQRVCSIMLFPFYIGSVSRLNDIQQYLWWKVEEAKSISRGVE